MDLDDDVSFLADESDGDFDLEFPVAEDGVSPVVGIIAGVIAAPLRATLRRG